MFNNTAICAEAAVTEFGAKRVAIVDVSAATIVGLLGYVLIDCDHTLNSLTYITATAQRKAF